jgi:hypothetical protein
LKAKADAIVARAVSRPHPGPLAIEVTLAGEVEPGAVEGDLGLDDARQPGDVDLFGRGDLLRDPVDQDADLGELGDELLLRLFDGEVGVGRLELDQDLAGLNAVADVMPDGEHAANLLGPDGHLVPPLERADDVDGPLERPLLDLRQRDRHRPGRLAGAGGLFSPGSAARQRQGEENQAEDHPPRATIPRRFPRSPSNFPGVSPKPSSRSTTSRSARFGSSGRPMRR